MEVIVASSAGFCWGVQRAIEKAQSLARKGPSRVWTDGPLIHNRQMMERLRTESVLETSSPESLDEGVLLIRAHGISPDRLQALRKIKIPLHNGTCPDVARIQGVIRSYGRKGYHTVIFGEPEHPEVQGLLGYAEGRGHVVSSEADVAKLPDLEPVCLVSQSTQFVDKFEHIAEAVRRRFPGAVVVNTICSSTRRRQQEVRNIAERVDAFVVVGGLHSANTRHLVELAGTLRPTFHVETEDGIDPACFQSCRRIGLTAGASTPPFVIEAVRQKLEAIPPLHQGFG